MDQRCSKVGGPRILAAHRGKKVGGAAATPDWLPLPAVLYYYALTTTRTTFDIT